MYLYFTVNNYICECMHGCPAAPDEEGPEAYFPRWFFWITILPHCSHYGEQWTLFPLLFSPSTCLVRVLWCEWVPSVISVLSTLVCCSNLPFSPLKSLSVLHYKYQKNVSRKKHINACYFVFKDFIGGWVFGGEAGTRRSIVFTFNFMLTNIFTVGKIKIDFFLCFNQDIYF